MSNFYYCNDCKKAVDLDWKETVDVEKWHKWFSWYPVQVKKGHYVWLEWVLRREYCGQFDIYVEYKRI